MKFQSLPAAAILAVLLGLAAPAWSQTHVLVSNTFDTDPQGWTSVGSDASGNTYSPPALTWFSNQGNPGGAVRYDSLINPPYTGFFLAPTNVVSALQSAVGGNITWDLATIHVPSAAFLIGNGRSDISISGGGNSIRQIVTAPSGPSLYPSFSHYNLDLTAAGGWYFNGVVTLATQAQIDTVLLNASRMTIRADYWDRTNSTSSILDNVVISAPVPEPETYGMFLAGLGMMGFMARRRKQRVVR